MGEGLWRFDNAITHFERARVENFAPFGTVTRYSVGMSDGTERVLIHGQALNKPASASVAPLTIATTPSLSLGPEGISMHFLLRMMKYGVDGIIFGPERSRKDLQLDEEGQRDIAGRLSLPGSADAMHKMTSRLADEQGIDLADLLWAGVSLGAMKGMAFAAMAGEHQRRTIYGHFAVPVRPEPAPAPTDGEFWRFALSEAPATIRFAGGVILHDLRKAQRQIFQDMRRHARPAEVAADMVHPLRLHFDIARLLVPGGLARHYARSYPRDPEFKIFTRGWLDAIANGDAGTAATRLPADQLFTIELFDKDEHALRHVWEEKTKEQRRAGTTYVIEEAGRHTDALNLRHQKKRAQWLKSVIVPLQQGVPVEAITHPLAPNR